MLGAALLGALSLGAPRAHAADPVTPRIGPEEGAGRKLERVLQSLPKEEATALRERLAKRPARDRLHALLLEKDAGYAKAVAAFDRDGTNAEDFAALARTTEAGALALALRAHATFFEGRSHLVRDEYDKACECFERVRGELRDGTPWTDEATLHLGYAYARRPDLEEDKERLWKTRAKAALDNLAPSDGSKPVFGQAPERTREAAAWLQKELRGEGSGPLLELVRRMEVIEREIDLTKTGKPTQKKQEGVIAELDRLIALMREKEQSGGGGGGGGGGKKGGRGGAGGRGGGGPAKESKLPGGLQPGEINKSKGGATQEWGALKEKDREQVLQILKEKFPERYKEIVEQYFLDIAKAAGGRSAATPKLTPKPGETKPGDTKPDAPPPAEKGDK